MKNDARGIFGIPSTLKRVLEDAQSKTGEF